MTTQPIGLPTILTQGFQNKLESLVQAFRQSFSRMSDIKKELEEALLVDISALSACVTGCIAKLHEEIERQKQEYSQSISELATVFETKTIADSTAQAMDPVTGLPNRPSAEELLRSILARQDHAPVFVAIVVVEHLSSINSNYGYEAGNQVLRRCAGDLHPQLKPDDKLFRWDGPALAIVLERPHYQEAVDYVAAKVVKRFSHSLVLEARHAQLFITTQTGVFPVEGAVEKLPIADIEAFVQGRAAVPNYAEPPVPHPAAEENAPTPEGKKPNRPPIVRVRRTD
jgi:diguanylate cyclase (GGDEF)-like protein